MIHNEDLTLKVCVACEGGVPPLTEAEALVYMPQVSGWEPDAAWKKIERTWTFKDFAEALHFVNRVAECAEKEGHHPDITIRWNKVLLSLTTHAIGGLSENDFILAAKINKLDP